MCIKRGQLLTHSTPRCWLKGYRLEMGALVKVRGCLLSSLAAPLNNRYLDYE